MPGCRCRAKVVEADPPQGSFWIWAVGVYHTFPSINCQMSNGPAGVLWNEGEVYEFDACNKSGVMFEFAVSPLQGNYDSVYVHINLNCWSIEGGYEDEQSLSYYFYAPPGVDVEDEQQCAAIAADCTEVEAYCY